MASKIPKVNVARYAISINGKKLSQSRYNCINSVSIKETVDGSTTANIKISDPNFKFINDNIYREEATIKITMRWYGKPTKTVFRGYISAINIQFPSNGLPTLDINCMDITHRMNRKKRKKTYKNKTSRYVVKKIAKRYGLKVKFTKGWKSVKQESITQSSQTDIDFLKNLADSEKYPFAVYVRNKTLYYVRKGIVKGKTKATLHYMEYPYTIIEYNPTITKEEVKKIEKAKSTKKKKKKVKSNSKKSIRTQSKKPSSSSSTSSGSRTTTSGGKTKTYDPVTKKWK